MLIFYHFDHFSYLGEAIVTGAGDETLRFWNVFSKARSQKVEKTFDKIIHSLNSLNAKPLIIAVHLFD